MVTRQKHYQLTELFALFDWGATRIESLDKLEYPGQRNSLWNLPLPLRAPIRGTGWWR